MSIGYVIEGAIGFQPLPYGHIGVTAAASYIVGLALHAWSCPARNDLVPLGQTPAASFLSWNAYTDCLGDYSVPWLKFRTTFIS